MKRSPTVHLLAALLALSACVGGQTGEPPAEPQRSSHVELDAGCDPRDCPAPSPDLGAFSSLIGSGGSRAVPPGLDVAVAGADIVLLGELAGVSEGRREDIGLAWTYASYVNLLIRPISIYRGELEGDGQVALELQWPNNAPLDELISRAPLGVRLLLLANRVTDAEERARPLEEAGIGTGTIAPNLFHLTPYNLGFENSDGLVAEEAFDGYLFIWLVTGTPPPNTPALPFQTAIEAVMASASKL